MSGGWAKDKKELGFKLVWRFLYIDIYFNSGKILTLYTVILSGLFFAQNYSH